MYSADGNAVSEYLNLLILLFVFLKRESTLCFLEKNDLSVISLNYISTICGIKEVERP